MIEVANLSPSLAILFGLLILVFPRFLNYFIALWLVIHGLLGLGVLVRTPPVRRVESRKVVVRVCLDLPGRAEFCRGPSRFGMFL